VFHLCRLPVRQRAQAPGQWPLESAIPGRISGRACNALPLPLYETGGPEKKAGRAHICRCRGVPIQSISLVARAIPFTPSELTRQEGDILVETPAHVDKGNASGISINP